MRIFAAAWASTAIGVLMVVPIVLTTTPPARADPIGYYNCLSNSKDNPVTQPDPKNLYTGRLIEMDLKSGVSREAEARKVAQMGYPPAVADAIVGCVISNSP